MTYRSFNVSFDIKTCCTFIKCMTSYSYVSQVRICII